MEALHLDLPDVRGIALVYHPHPLFTGAIQNKAVATLQHSTRDTGLVTLRFNSRGVGQSADNYGEGTDEIDDAEAAVRWLLTHRPGLSLILMGFFFGSHVADSLADHLEAEGIELTRLFMIMSPVERPAVSLSVHCPLAMMRPKDDDVVTPAAVYAWSKSLVRPYELLRVTENRHFFHGKLIDLKDLLLPRLQD